MRSTFSVPCTCVALVLSLLPARVAADPIVVTGGAVTSTGIFMNAALEMTGDGFLAAGRTHSMVFIGPATCYPCAAGELVPLEANVFDRFEQARITLDGESLDNVGLMGALQFDASAIVMPSVEAAFTVSRPFVLSGILFGFLDPLLEPTEFIFERSLTGRGTVTASFVPSARHPDDPILFSFDSVRYDFEAPAPVPEPASMLLVGTGLGGMAWGWRRRRRALSSQP